MQSIVSKGKNIQEAINTGLNLMEVSKSEVNIEIIQNESKGILRIGSKKAIVKLTKESKQSDAERSPKNIDLIDKFEELVDELPLNETNDSEKINTDSPVNMKTEEGNVWVSSGKIHVKDAPMKYPTVTVSNDIKLIKNNHIIKSQTLLVSEEDVLETHLEESIQETKWKVTLDRYKLNAILEVEPGYKITRRLRDVNPGEHIELLVEELKEVQNTLDYTDIINKLEAKQISYGINQTEITRALNAISPDKFEIATGKSAEQGKNGSIDLKVNIETKTVLQEDKSGNVNFRDIRIIPTVEKGETLGIIYPPLPGNQGITVTNEVIPPKPVYPITVRDEKGVIVVENKIMATESGRPSIQKRGQLVKVSVMPKLMHDGNVDISSGNIRFDGDVEIIGEVEENMIVESGSEIIVHKSVNEATLTSLNSIVVYGNVASSILSAGKNSMLIVELGQLLKTMHFQTEKIITVIVQLTQATAFKSSDFSRAGIQPLIRILLEKKFNTYKQLAKQYVEMSNKDKEFLEDDWLRVSVSINEYFLKLSRQDTTIEQIRELSKKMKDLYEISLTPEEPGSYLTISNALNSSLYCSGNILVVGQGCINTKIHSGGRLNVTGILRGGEVYGKLGTDLNEVGSSSGTQTIVEVPADKTIKIKKVYEGTTLKIGKVTYTIEETKSNILALLSNDGRIIFE